MKSGSAFAEPPNSELAAEAAQLAENLPDGAAIEVTHLADLLKYLSREDRYDCNRFVTILQM